MELLSVNSNLLFNAANVLLLYFLVRRFLFKPIEKILQERQSLIQSSLDEAHEAKEQAQLLKEQQQLSMRGVEREKLVFMQQAQRNAAEEYRAIVRQAKHQADDILQQAQDEAQSTKAELFRQAKHELNDLILNATQRVLGGADSEQALYDEFLKRAGGEDAKSGS